MVLERDTVRTHPARVAGMFSRQARRNPHFDGVHSARRGTYRIAYRINGAQRVVEIRSIRHRRDAYRWSDTCQGRV
ncbi:type II toxin-antitoxin system RelE family toxin [Micromonospora rosaria]|uniref:type II toxin-antitoxin system RelE family toxin n=1 Tax=Micromonospora rosaria TaxID=47874 RepID=UPI0012F848BA|nr:type II toxin-antitoxin system RelE/ParE family toxin [Micromonospora rosaria]